MVMVQCTSEDGGGGDWRWIIDYHVLHWDVVVLRLPAGQPVGSNGCHLLVVHRPPVARALEREEAMVGSSGVDKRKGTDADDCGYDRRSSLYSNGGQAEGRTCGAEVATSATAYH